MLLKISNFFIIICILKQVESLDKISINGEWFIDENERTVLFRGNIKLALINLIRKQYNIDKKRHKCCTEVIPMATKRKIRRHD